MNCIVDSGAHHSTVMWAVCWAKHATCSAATTNNAMLMRGQGKACALLRCLQLPVPSWVMLAQLYSQAKVLPLLLHIPIKACEWIAGFAGILNTVRLPVLDL